MEYTGTLKVNGRCRSLTVHPTMSLLDALREKLGVTGPKKGCGTGDCGTCLVLLDGLPVNSCLVPALAAQGRTIITVEGLGTPANPHPLQAAIVELGGTQCGICTPGILIALKGLLDENPDPTEDDIRFAISGNLCRCTGYMKIIETAMEAARRMATAQ
ncbi:MAG: (2Fe-2S)-binding protein [Anaerolineae bacterium]